jgi:hypothetical protein
LRNAIALHEDHFVFERRERILLDPFDHQVAQALGLIAVHEHQPGG